MSFVDRQQMTDAATASVETAPVSPKFPCPKCGAESRAHGEARRHDESLRVCSSPPCRLVQVVEEVTALTSDAPRFPCAKCGKETKVRQSGRAVDSVERVCSALTCRNIFRLS